MRHFKYKLAILAVSTMFGAHIGHAVETTGEKAAVAGETAGRKLKKGVNRVKEAVCMEGDVKCAAKKAGHRVDEAAEATADKVKEVKNKVD